MKTLIIFLTVLVSLYGFKSYRFLKNNVKKVQKVTFEQQLTTFETLGFKLNKGIAKENLISFYGNKSEFEKDPWVLMYTTLGMEIEKEPWTPITDRCWHFDLEAIEDNGAYVDIMKNISRITNGELKFENIKDYVDIDNEKAWVSFEINGDKYKWDLKVDNDWADGALFDKVQDLTAKYKTSGKFTFYGLGQDFILGYETEANLKKIKEQTGLKIEWLKAKGHIY
ncbi:MULTISPECIES: hypothetical protein [Flavobacterium]|uniref:hypothetical protein n=1 Tax=Flavobacterium TaxID=237 RepID=UPI001FCAED51|nr:MULTISPECIES: hypothetical protein [Flavobacterium]UOK42193.1 hypothetical protein LZF87_12850 [Flavobacterium enshiense]